VLSELWFVRHGATEWSDSGRHTSRTDIALTDEGRAAARALAAPLAAHEFSAVFASPMARARETAALAGFPDAVVVDDLHEWDYGELEGLTTDEIRGRGGPWTTWTIWTGAVPGGEDLASVAARAESIIGRAARVGGDVLCFGHGHALRVLTAVVLKLAPGAGARFALGPATINVIGDERDERALRVFNDRRAR
jgi:broad specificity phosphatase PhoE